MQGALHPLRLGGAGVVDLNCRRVQQGLIPLPQAVRGDGRSASLIAQLVHAEGLLPAHDLGQAVAGIHPLVVDLAPDAVQQVGLLPGHIVGPEDAVFRGGVQQHLAQQGGGGLQNGLPLQGVGVVQETGHKAHALGLALVAHHGLDGSAIQLVQGGGHGLHIRVGPGAPAEHGGDQGILRRRGPVQGGHQSDGQIRAFELVGVDRAQPHAGEQLPALHFRHKHDSFLLCHVGPAGGPTAYSSVSHHTTTTGRK